MFWSAARVIGAGDGVLQTHPCDPVGRFLDVGGGAVDHPSAGAKPGNAGARAPGHEPAMIVRESDDRLRDLSHVA